MAKSPNDYHLHVLSLPDEDPMRFGHLHDGHMYEYNRDEEEPPVLPGHRATPYHCEVCGDRIVIQVPHPGP